MEEFPANFAKQPAQRQKPDCRAGADADEKEQPELPQPHIEGEQQKAEQCGQAEPEIQQMGEAAKPLPNHPQNIVVDGGGNAQQHGQQKLDGLQRDGKLHQPNSREKKPPDF